MARDQLGRRLEVSHLDWGLVDADPRAVRLWEGRSTRTTRLSVSYRQCVRTVITAWATSSGEGADVIALDWATFGWEPLGFDLGAHLGLSSGPGPEVGIPGLNQPVGKRHRR